MILRRAAVSSALLALVVVSSGCIPDRDNPNDPAVSLTDPIAKLKITNMSPRRDEFGRPIDISPTERDCSNLSDPLEEDISALTTFSRGRCIVMDATNSTPGEDADPELTVEFFVHPGGGLPPVAVASSSMRAAIAGLDLPVPWDRPEGLYPADEKQSKDVVVELRVVDSNGNDGTTTETITLTNQPPRAVAPAPLTLQDGGAVWDPDSNDLLVEFNASGATDPDEDRLYYCWYVTSELTPVNGQYPEDPCIDTTSEAAFTEGSHRTVLFDAQISGAGMNTVSLVVSDDTYHTQRQFGSAIMGSTPYWGFEESSGSLVTVDVARTSNAVPAEATGVNGYVSGGGSSPELVYAPNDRRDDLVIYQVGVGTTSAGIDFGTLLGSGSEILAAIPSFTPGFSPPSPPDQYARRFWVIAKNPLGELTVTLIVKEDQQLDYTVRDTWEPDVPLVGFFDEGILYGLDQVSRDDHFGDLWFSTQFGDATYGLHFNWAMQTIEELPGSPIPTEPNRIPTGIAVYGLYQQGGTTAPELWIMYSRNVLLGGNTATAKAVVRTAVGEPCYPQYEVNFAPESFEDEEIPTVAWGLAFSGRSGGGERGVWTNLFSRGLAHMLVQPSSFNDCQPTMAVQSLAPDVTLGFQLFADEQVGQVAMLEDGNNSYVRMVPGGKRVRSETDLDIRGIWRPFGSFLANTILFDAENGGGQATLVSTIGGGPDGVSVRSRINPSPLEKARAIDIPTGYFWSGTILPAEVILMDPGGDIIDRFDSVGTEDNIIGPPVLIRSDPATRNLAVFTSDVATALGATKLFLIAPSIASKKVGVANPVPGFTTPDVSTVSNIPLGYRIVDAAFQASYDGSRLAALAIDPADSNSYHLVRFDETYTSYSADVELTDLASGSRIVFGRDLATGEIALAYRSTAANGLVLERFDPTLASSDVYDFAVGNDDPWYVSCLNSRCYVTYDDGGGDPAGLAQVTDAAGTMYVFDNGLNLLPDDCREVHVKFSFDAYPRIIAVGQSSIARLQAPDHSLFDEEEFFTDGRMRLYEP